ncbi:MAG TPA: serine hydrolase domain-containing protein [Verrucomicrobiae bacterium]
MQRHLIALLAFCLVVPSLHAASPNPSKAGMDALKLTEIPRRMQGFVDSNIISGAVTLVARNGQLAALDVVGYSDLATKKPLRADDMFWIASMTKPMTATAIMMLQDEGKLSVDDPVEKHLPEFKNQWLVDSQSKDGMVLKRPARPITLRDLLTHTSGIGDVPAPRYNCTLAELAMAYSQQPLRFPPGSKWQYSNPGINTLGRIVEVASGKTYAEFMQERIFNPLGMKDTTFHPTAAQVKRIAKSYKPGAGGKGLEETTVYFVQGGISDKVRTAFPAGGLFSTAEDVLKFYEMMLNGGVWKGKRLLSEAAVKQATTTQSGDIKTGFVDGMSFGFGFAVVKEPQGVTGMLAKGTYGHGGAYATQSWADPEKKLIVILMLQRAGLPNGDASEMRKAFQEAAAAAVVK